ncbi:hypothetical protein WJX73_000614 [Symbiochloris irregularis]|uniref:FAD-binding domain-containing protein n=1 Tax=Symbiochloris irregularis TaxID=706552 RepID=A0AAW1PLR2_9CHLO
MAYLAGKRVAISGAGIGGTTFALALEKACKARGVKPLPSITIYERDANASDRENLGYSFSIMQAGQGKAALGGLQVVRNLEQGIVEELAQLQEPGADSHICSQTMQPLIRIGAKRDDTGKTSEIMRIMRSNLRNTLLNHVPPSKVRYSSTCVSAVPSQREGQPVQLRFADDSTAECDLLVVADGANSKLRTALLPHEQNRYAGLCMLFGRTHELSKLPPEMAQGHYLVLGKKPSAMFMGCVNRNTVMWSLSSPAPQSAANDLNALFRDKASAQDFLDHEVPQRVAAAGCGGDLLHSIIDRTDVTSLLALSTMDKLPHPHNDNGIAYVGDAWHPMSPFSGAGANMALVDGWELAHELVEGGHSSAQAAIQQYSEKHTERSTIAINQGRRNMGFVTASGLKRWFLVAGIRTLGIVFGLLKSQKSLKTIIWPSFRK